MDTQAFQETADMIFQILQDHLPHKASRIYELPLVTATEVDTQRYYRRYRENGRLLQFIERVTKQED